MADAEVGILFKIIDKASAGLKGMTGNFKALDKTFQSLTGVSLSAAGGIALVGAAVQKAVKFVKESVAETVAYNKTIREMTQVTGLGADEISRIVQVGDDWGISIDAIRTSLAFMNKQGLTPSIDNLAKIADEYVAAKDKSAWANEAVKTLGRGYQTLIPILAKGGDALRAQTAAIDDNLIATEDSIRASRNYEVAVDDLQDTWTALKYEIGNEVLPVLTDLLTSTKELTDRNKEVTTTSEKLTISFKAGTISQEDYAKARHALMYETDGLVTAQLALDEANKDVFASATMLYPEETRLLDIYDDLNVTVPILSDAEGELTTETDKATEATKLASEAYWRANSAAQTLKNEGIDFLHSGIDSLVNEAMADFEGSMVETMALQAAWEYATGLITEAQYEQKVALSETLAPLEAMIKLVDSNALSLGSLKIAMEDGVVTEEELKKALEATGMSARDAAAYIATMQANIDKLTDKKITITTTFREEYFSSVPPGHGGPPGGHYGLDFIVPPGYPNDSYPIRAESGERVIVVPAGKQGNTNTFNVNLMGSGSAGRDVLSSVRLLEMLYG